MKYNQIKGLGNQGIQAINWGEESYVLGGDILRAGDERKKSRWAFLPKSNFC